MCFNYSLAIIILKMYFSKDLGMFLIIMAWLIYNITESARSIKVKKFLEKIPCKYLPFTNKTANAICSLCASDLRIDT